MKQQFVKSADYDNVDNEFFIAVIYTYVVIAAVQFPIRYHFR